MKTLLDTAEQKVSDILSMLNEKNVNGVKFEITPTRYNNNLQIDFYFQTVLENSIISLLESNNVKTKFDSNTNTTTAYLTVSHSVCEYSTSMFSKSQRKS